MSSLTFYSRFIKSSTALKISKYLFFVFAGLTFLAFLSYLMTEGAFADNYDHCFGSYAGVRPEPFYDGCRGFAFFAYTLGNFLMLFLLAILGLIIDPFFALIDPQNFMDKPFIQYIIRILLDLFLLRLLVIYPMHAFRRRHLWT